MVAVSVQVLPPGQLARATAAGLRGPGVSPTSGAVPPVSRGGTNPGVALPVAPSPGSTSTGLNLDVSKVKFLAPPPVPIVTEVEGVKVRRNSDGSETRFVPIGVTSASEAEVSSRNGRSGRDRGKDRIDRPVALRDDEAKDRIEAKSDVEVSLARRGGDVRDALVTVGGSGKRLQLGLDTEGGGRPYIEKATR